MVDFKGMSGKQKAEYIWDYYKLHIIGAFVLIIIAGSFIHSQMTKVDYMFNLTMFGNAIEENKKSDLEKQLTNLLVEPGEKRKQASVDIIPVSNTTSSSNQYMQQFLAKLSVGEIDIVILDKSMFEALAKQNAFSSMDNLGGLDLASIKNEKIESIGSDNKNKVYGISAEDVKVLKDIGYDVKDKVICITVSSKEKAKAVLTLEWLLNK